MSSPRDHILGRVRAALAPLRSRLGYPDYACDAATMPGLPLKIDAVEVFKSQLQKVNGLVLESAADLAGWLQANGCKRGYCDPGVWPGLSAAFGSGFQIQHSLDRSRIDDHDFGITRAAGAIAESGSVVLKDASTSSRLAALAPWVHVAVVARQALYPDIATGIAALGNDPNVIWCTGPSKTADVEGILIQGVHGPGVQIALLAGLPDPDFPTARQSPYPS